MSTLDTGHVLDEWWAWARTAAEHDRCDRCHQPVRVTWDASRRLVTVGDASAECREARETPAIRPRGRGSR
jgi:hypothetical protein